jgi:hypothetical protein
MSCIEADVLLKWELGELTRNESEAVERHVSGCRICRASQAEQRELLDDLAGSAPADDDFVERVMSACETAAPVPPARAAFGRWGLLPAAVAAAGVAALVALFVGAPFEERRGEWTARGVTTERVGSSVQAFVSHSGLERAPVPLEGAELGPGDGIVVRYSNPSDEPAFLMVFAVDAAREVHWIHPAYLRVEDDPESVPLASRVQDRLLDEVGEPENPSSGAFQVYALVTRSALRVKQVEKLLAESREPVPELFPDASVEAWSSTWRAR